MRRSREGAWIEIHATRSAACSTVSRSREGAWIEICFVQLQNKIIGVAPARERGLKCAIAKQDTQMNKSLPRGSVD